MDTMEFRGSSKLMMDMLRWWLPDVFEPIEFMDDERCFLDCWGTLTSLNTWGLEEPLSVSDELMGLFLSGWPFMVRGPVEGCQPQWRR